MKADLSSSAQEQNKGKETKVSFFTLWSIKFFIIKFTVKKNLGLRNTKINIHVRAIERT